MDLIGIAFVMWLIVKATNKENLVGSLMCAFLFYLGVKIVLVWSYFGVSYPINVSSRGHLVCGLISAAFWAFIFMMRPVQKVRYFLAKRRLKNTMVTAIKKDL